MALREHDLESREDLTPWLSGVFVMPQHRSCGVGSALCQFVESHAQSVGVEQLYLFTLDHERTYARSGWRSLTQDKWRGHSATVMVKTLSTV